MFLAGFLLFLASAFQQVGIVYTTAGNAGFITSLYVVLVPIVLWLSGICRDSVHGFHGLHGISRKTPKKSVLFPCPSV